MMAFSNNIVLTPCQVS